MVIFTTVRRKPAGAVAITLTSLIFGEGVPRVALVMLLLCGGFAGAYNASGGGDLGEQASLVIRKLFPFAVLNHVA